MNTPNTSQAKLQTIAWARDVLQKNAVFLDFETTGIRDAQIVQVGAIDAQGNILMETLVRPAESIPAEVTAIHGITDAMVSDAPTFRQLYVKLSTLLAGRVVVAYNAPFEQQIIAGECKRLHLPQPRVSQWECAMRAYAQFWGVRDPRRGGYTWQKLTQACFQQGIIVADAHQAVGDCQMTLALVKKMADL